MKRAVLTGAGGYLGSRLAKRLANLDVELVLIARNFDRTKDAIQEAGRAVVGGCSCDLASAEARAAALQPEVFDGVQVVFHLAADLSFLGSVTQLDTNVVATDALYECAAAAGVDSFVYASSVDATGSSPWPEARNIHEYGLLSPYGLSKLQAEERLLAKRDGPRVQIARLGMLVGADDNLQGGLAALALEQPHLLAGMLDVRAPVAPTEDALDALLEMAGTDRVVRQHVFATNPTLRDLLESRDLPTPTGVDERDARAALEVWVSQRLIARQADLATYLAWPSPGLAGRTLQS